MTDDTEPIPESPPHTRRCWSYITFGDGACDCGVDVPADPEPCFHDICDGEPECLLPAHPEDGAR